MDFFQGDLGHLLQCLYVKKIPRSPTLWAPEERESNLQHPLLPNKPVALAGVPCHSQRGTGAYG